MTVKKIKAVDLSPGMRTDTFQLTETEQWIYSVAVPEIAEGEKVPLILALHWTPANSGADYLSCLAEPGLRETGAIIFAPYYNRSNWWVEENETLLRRFLDLVPGTWPIDPNRIAVTGYSNGGIGTWHYAELLPDVFAAAIPMAAQVETNRNIELPLYIIHGENDTSISFATAEADAQSMKQAGVDLTFVKADGLTHTQACDYVSYLQEAATWLQTKW
ncbi:MAG: dienelactone hydrolase family protein [Bacteroidota bacterium]